MNRLKSPKLLAAASLLFVIASFASASAAHIQLKPKTAVGPTIPPNPWDDDSCPGGVECSPPK